MIRLEQINNRDNDLSLESEAYSLITNIICIMVKFMSTWEIMISEYVHLEEEKGFESYHAPWQIQRHWVSQTAAFYSADWFSSLSNLDV